MQTETATDTCPDCGAPSTPWACQHRPGCPIWQVRIDTEGRKSEVNQAGERREHVHNWQSGRDATGQGFLPSWHCRPCMSGRGADVELFFNLLRRGWRSWR